MIMNVNYRAELPKYNTGIPLKTSPKYRYTGIKFYYNFQH